MSPNSSSILPSPSTLHIHSFTILVSHWTCSFLYSFLILLQHNSNESTYLHQRKRKVKRDNSYINYVLVTPHSHQYPFSLYPSSHLADRLPPLTSLSSRLSSSPSPSHALALSTHPRFAICKSSSHGMNSRSTRGDITSLIAI